jgi:hypothetical protein
MNATANAISSSAQPTARRVIDTLSDGRWTEPKPNNLLQMRRQGGGRLSIKNKAVVAAGVNA